MQLQWILKRSFQQKNKPTTGPCIIQEIPTKNQYEKPIGFNNKNNVEWLHLRRFNSSATTTLFYIFYCYGILDDDLGFFLFSVLPGEVKMMRETIIWFYINLGKEGNR